VVNLNYQLIWLPVFGIIISFLPGLLAYLWSAKKFSDYLERGSYLLAAILSNFGMLGALCAFIIYGETGFAYVQLATFPQHFIMFLFCFPLARYCYHQSRNTDQQKIPLADIFLNKSLLPVVGLLCGVLLYSFDIPRPEILGTLFSPLVHLAAWTAMIPLGFSIDLAEMRRCYRKILDLIPIKFVITPLLTYFLARQVISDDKVINTLLIMASTPTAINAVVIAKLHNLNVNIAMAAFVLTTTVYLLVVFPAISLWILSR
jgi:predicted permease